VPKSVTLAALEEIGGAAFACGYSKSKKAELSETAERIFAGHAAPADVKERALAWVPEAMRFAAASEAPANVPDESPPWEDPSEDTSDTAEVSSGAEEHSGGEIAPPASIAPEGEAFAGHRSSRRRKGSGKEAGGDVPSIVLEEAA
jgi:ParB family chromosome partitioning protein